MGSSTYMGESKNPQISKLINENTNLSESVSTLRSGNEELKANQEKMVDALKQFRNKLQEVAVFNSNLTYAVRLFTEQSTTKEEKQEILKRLDEAKSLKESQSIYKQLVKEFTNSKPTIKESVEEKLNKTASSGSVQISEQTVFVHPELQNMKKLWEYGYKK
jgi:catalase